MGTRNASPKSKPLLFGGTVPGNRGQSPSIAG